MKEYTMSNVIIKSFPPNHVSITCGWEFHSMFIIFDVEPVNRHLTIRRHSVCIGIWQRKYYITSAIFTFMKIIHCSICFTILKVLITAI